MPRVPREQERGQAFLETVAIAFVLVLVAYGLLAWVPVHRARSVATSAAYVCVTFAAESSDPDRARWMGMTAAKETVTGDWSASLGIRYTIDVEIGNPGQPTTCRVTYESRGWFHYPGARGTITLMARSEKWKARWNESAGRP